MRGNAVIGGRGWALLFVLFLFAILGFDGEVDRVGYLFGKQGNVEYLSDVMHIVELQSFEVAGLYVFNIFAVFVAKYDFFDAGTFGSQYLFLDTAHGQHTARRVISPVMARWARTLRWVNDEAMEVTMVIPADGPSLGMAPSGTCMCRFQWSNT